VQVTLRNDEIDTVVASFQNSENEALEKLVREKIAARRYLINPAGVWNMGGLDADSGLSGRKIVVDAYGPRISVGGGSFSGKDYTKVDRSGAYMARKIAVDLLAKYKAEEVIVRLAYAIGIKDPVMAMAIVDGQEMDIIDYDLSPAAMKGFLKLNEVKFAETAPWGHFGRGFSWDK
jgi:S-adenosylmethionine synthetase